MSGVELGERILDERPETALVLMSGYADQVSFERLQGIAVTFLRKPFTQTDLLRTIRETLSRAHGLHASGASL
jgi:FixJ family two-component response regulator